MPSELKAGSLTTLDRVKLILEIETAKTQHDAVLERMINGASAFIEKVCNRTFKQATYTEKISNSVRGADIVFLKQAPVTSVTSLKYRAGTPDVPNYQSYLASEYELEGDGNTGMVRLYGSLPVGSNVLQCVYLAGYVIDFANLGNHTLPDDITRLCENMVVKSYKRRTAKGKQSETGAGGDSVTWQKEMDEEDRETLIQYQRVRFI